jgi:hypothetical protein
VTPFGSTPTRWTRPLKGDPAINNHLSALRSSGRQLLVTEPVETELLYRNDLTVKKTKPFVQQIPEPSFRARMEKALRCHSSLLRFLEFVHKICRIAFNPYFYGILIYKVPTLTARR